MNIHPEQFRLILFFAMLIIMCLAEQFVPSRPWHDKKLKRWLFHGGLSVMNTIFTRLVLAGPLLMWIHYVAEKEWGLSHVLGVSGGLEIALTIILFDGFDYGWHRLNHVVPFFWRFHKAHHFDTHVDLTTSLRFHPGELCLSYGAKSIWILLWGPSVMGFLLFESLITMYSQFHHSNIDFPDGFENKLRWIHMTPRLHTSHHTVSLRTRNANYSTIFLIWDRLFGTLREPERSEMTYLGIEGGRKSDLSLMTLLKAPFMKL